MSSMSQTIARLTALHKPSDAFGQSDRLTDLHGFGSNPGALRARTYIPEDLPHDAPLVVVLHGCTQNAGGYDYGSGWSTLADRHGFALLFPEQQRANNANLCFNWFVPGDVRRDAGETLSIRQMVAAVVSAHGIDERRIFVTGLSAGGAMTSVMLATYPELFAGGAIVAGLPFGCANSMPEALDRMRGTNRASGPVLEALIRSASPHKGPWPKVSVWHGSADHVVAPANAGAIVDQWRGVHGVGDTPSRVEKVDGFTRRTWTGPDGIDRIEAYDIAGMGHGTPLDTTGPDGCGHGGPHMLDVGISSTRRIAEFWALTSSSTGRAEPVRAARPAAPPAMPVMHAVAPRKPAPRPAAHGTDVGKIIEDALRTAGLMR